MALLVVVLVLWQTNQRFLGSLCGFAPVPINLAFQIARPRIRAREARADSLA